jgi:hypothetical protein
MFKVQPPHSEQLATVRLTIRTAKGAIRQQVTIMISAQSAYDLRISCSAITNTLASTRRASALSAACMG